jgi:hypothetical protein
VWEEPEFNFDPGARARVFERESEKVAEGGRRGRQNSSDHASTHGPLRASEREGGIEQLFLLVLRRPQHPPLYRELRNRQQSVVLVLTCSLCFPNSSIIMGKRQRYYPGTASTDKRTTEGVHKSMGAEVHNRRTGEPTTKPSGMGRLPPEIWKIVFEYVSLGPAETAKR